VFTETSDPVGAGFVESLARPGGNGTGFTSIDDYGTSAKMAGGTQANHAGHHASGRPSQSHRDTGQLATIQALALAVQVRTGHQP
jgi:putative tryptophan/tyrosine transport system substrate-binding protein